VYDRHDRSGGLMMYGIPGFKLEKDGWSAACGDSAESGIDFVQGFEVGREASLTELRARHDAV
jgi:glutamate synthase (NADPH/NADH) small chain